MFKKLGKIVLAVAMLMSTMAANGITASASESVHYQIYPQPHDVVYKDSDYIMRPDVNLVFDETIDVATHNRMLEALNVKGMKATASVQKVEGKLNVLIGTKGSGGYVDTYVNEHYDMEEGLFEKTDAYFLASDQGTISILGADSDAAFYGITSLLQIFQQLEGYTISDFTMEDYADVVSRGFIEGYYGNPWSNEDRIDLMKFGGYYKLNSYFYAPKDDPKHNARWKELYTEEELVGIKQLADAGNASKCRFVFALHPFMSNAMRFDTESNYQEDFSALKAKYKQVIDNGVRQIAILADDARDVGANNYKRVLKDLTEFLKEEQKNIPDLKLTLPFCPVSYGGYGESWFRDLGDNIQVVMTGGRVWGEVSNSFTSTFTATAGRGPYMWINWPCTDNSNKHLIMGGNSTFLQPGVDPANIQGIILNPMEHSEPSKVGIFANAAYAWNIWETNEEADKAWEDSFSYVDHNSPVATQSSDAFRELSKHMINQNMDSRVTVLQESVELKPILEDFKAKFANGTLTVDDVNKVIAEFKVLKEAADTYKNNPGNARTRDQILPFLESWLDMSDAAIYYLECIRADIYGDSAMMMDYYAKGQESFKLSKSHTFISKWTEVVAAEVGVQHIIPFIKVMDEKMANKIKEVVDPNVVTQNYITNRTDKPSGDIANVFDDKKTTEIVYQNPNSIKVGEYVGIMFNKAIDVQQINFELGANSNLRDTFAKAKLQYTVDGNEWLDVDGEVYTLPNSVEKTNLTMKAKGIRMIATEAKTNTWLGVRDIIINKKSVVQPSEETYTGTFTMGDMVVRSGNLSMLSDGNDSTEAMFARSAENIADKDSIIAGATLTFTMDKAKPVGAIRIAQGTSSAGDVLKNAAVEYLDADNNWVKLGDFTNKKVQEYNANGIVTKAIRIRNIEKVPVWWRLGEVSVKAPKKEAAADSEHVYANIDTDITSQITVGKGLLSEGDVRLEPNQYIGLLFDNIKEISGITTSELPEGIVLQTSMNEVQWFDVNDDGYQDARFIRLINNHDNAVDFTLSKFEVLVNDIAPISVESTIAINEAYGSGDMRKAGNVANVFDNQLNTSASIAGYPTKDSTITFDLGQNVSFDSIRYYIVETDKNYIRDAQFAISNDKENWTDVMFVGDGEENNTYDESVAKDASYLTHDSKNPGYMYAEGTEIGGVEGRYIRVTMTTNYSYRFVAFNEIQINGGTYLPASNNKDIVASCVEEAGKSPLNLFDGNIASTWKPSKTEGTMEYRLSALKDVKTIRFVQKGISNAAVKGVFFDLDTNEEEIVTLGTLNQMISEFIVPEGKLLLRTMISWGDTIPEISEILTTKIQNEIDKEALKAEIDKEVDTTNWTASSKARYETAKQIAQAIYDNAYVSQATIDSALGSLQNTIQAVDLIGDAAGLQALVDTAPGNDDGIYTQRSYEAYASVLNKANKALEDKENLTKLICDKLVADLTAGKANLVYSPVQKELAILCAEDTNAFVASIDEANYTTMSYKMLIDALAELKPLAESDDMQNPSVYREAVTAVKDAKENLTDIQALKAVIASARDLNAADYTAESYAVLTEAITAGEALYAEGSKEAVDQAVEAVKEAIKQLAPATGKESIEKTILDAAVKKAMIISDAGLDHIAKPVVDRFDMALQAAVDVLANPESTPEAMMDAWFNLANAMHYLDFHADKTQLNALLVQADEINKNLDAYKEEGKQEFKDAYANAKEVAGSDTVLDESINKAHDRLATAISRLKPVNNFDTTVLQYIIKQADEAIADEQYYQKNAAWDTFVTAYNKAKDVYANPSSQKEINDAAMALASAYEDIRLIPDEEHLQEYAVLKYLIDETKGAIDEADYYEKNAAWDAFVKAYDKAELLYGHANSRKALRLAAAKLADAYENIRLIANEDRLNELNSFIKSMNAIDANLYSIEDYALIQDAKEYAQNLYVKGKFTTEEFNGFGDKKALADEAVKRIIDTTVTPEEPKNPTVPEGAAQPEQPLESMTQQPAEGPSSQNNNVVNPTGTTKTGDTTNVGMIVGVMVVALGIGAFVLIRKKKSSKK